MQVIIQRTAENTFSYKTFFLLENFFILQYQLNIQKYISCILFKLHEAFCALLLRQKMHLSNIVFLRSLEGPFFAFTTKFILFYIYQKCFKPFKKQQSFSKNEFFITNCILSPSALYQNIISFENENSYGAMLIKK